MPMPRANAAHVMALTAVVTLEGTVLALPALSIDSAGRAAWVLVLLGWLLSVLAVLILTWSASCYPTEEFETYILRSFGALGGRLFMLVGIGFNLAVAAADLSMLHQSVFGVFLTRTPDWAIIGLAVLVAGYAAWTHLAAGLRIGVLLLSLLIYHALVLILLFIPQVRLGNLLPLLDFGPGPGRPAMLVAALTAFRYPVLVPFTYTLTDDHRRFLPAVIAGSSIGMVIVLLFTMLPVAVFGPVTARLIAQPFPDLTAILAVHRSFFDRPEHLARLVFNVNIFASVGMALFVAARQAAAVVGRANYRPWVPVMGFAAILLGTSVIRGGWQVEAFAASGLVGYAGLLPAFLVVIARAPRRRRARG